MNKLFVDKNELYKSNQCIFKIYNSNEGKKIKLVNMYKLRQKGYEFSFEYENNHEQKARKGTKNEIKMKESISRTKTHIFDLAYCNNWEYFFTGTLDKTKYARNDLEKYREDLSQYIRNFNRLHKLSIKYLFVPELHADKTSWHFHGFIMGLPQEYIKQFQLGDKMSSQMVEMIKEGRILYNWLGYAEKFGYVVLEKIKSTEAISKYITKYINKELENSITELNAHKFYASKGLKLPEIKKCGYLNIKNVLTFYTHNIDNFVDTNKADYCTTYWLNYSAELENIIMQNYFADIKE